MTAVSMMSLAPNYRALVFGASGGIGAALVRALADDPRCGVVHAAARNLPAAAGKIRPLAFDLEDETSIAGAVTQAAADGPLDLVIIATGLLHDAAIKPEKSWVALDGAALERNFRINTIGPALIAKHALGQLARGRKVAFAALSARVGSIADNGLGGWHSYRASKAALNMLVRNCAIELARRNGQALCVSLHPGTVDTGLSKPFQSGVAPGKLFTPDYSAACLLAVLDGLTARDTGKLYAWDGAEIPF